MRFLNEKPKYIKHFNEGKKVEQFDIGKAKYKTANLIGGDPNVFTFDKSFEKEYEKAYNFLGFIPFQPRDKDFPKIEIHVVLTKFAKYYAFSEDSGISYYFNKDKVEIAHVNKEINHIAWFPEGREWGYRVLQEYDIIEIKG